MKNRDNVPVIWHSFPGEAPTAIDLRGLQEELAEHGGREEVWVLEHPGNDLELVVLLDLRVRRRSFPLANTEIGQWIADLLAPVVSLSIRRWVLAASIRFHMMGPRPVVEQQLLEKFQERFGPTSDWRTIDG